MPEAATLHSLTHVDLRTPHTRLAVSAIKAIEMSDGLAFKATLRLDGRIVGWAENAGLGGETAYIWNGRAGLPFGDWMRYVAACRTGEGHKVSEADVLTALVEDYEQAKTLAADAKRGLTSLRRVQWLFGTAQRIETAGIRVPVERAIVIRTVVLRDMPPTDGQWWQIWNGTKWVDLTARPAPNEPLPIVDVRS